MVVAGEMHIDAWQLTPFWHPYRWFGYTMRRWIWDDWSIGGEYDGQWEYASYRQCALEVLERSYGRS